MCSNGVDFAPTALAIWSKTKHEPVKILGKVANRYAFGPGAKVFSGRTGYHICRPVSS